MSRRTADYCKIEGSAMHRAEGEGRPEMTFDRSPASDLWRHTLSQIPTTFGRLVFLSTLRDPNTGVYAHYGFAQRVGEEVSAATLRQSHEQCFAEWINFKLEEQKADLDLYLSGIEGDKRTILDTWLRTKPYRSLIPVSAQEIEKQLYYSDLETLLELLSTVHGVSCPNRDA
jgi:hypothetical protein